jgi:hypothetical protein
VLASKCGITGTRFGWTPEQEGAFRTFLRDNVAMTEFHHGLCVGIDAQGHEAVREIRKDVRIVGHPSVDKKLEVVEVSRCDELREDKTHFARNRNIVNETDAIVVIPAQSEWQPQGGTWYTHDYAVKRGKPVLIIWPDGMVQNTPATNDADKLTISSSPVKHDREAR